VDTRRALCVLVVDDCRDQVNSLALLITLWGHQALVASDGSAALDMAWPTDPMSSSWTSVCPAAWTATKSHISYAHPPRRQQHFWWP
jgi:hypothetical protein